MKKHRVLKVIAFVAVSAAAVYAINSYINYEASRKKLLGCDAEDFYNWKGTKVFYKKTGSGSPVLLVHNLNPSSSAFEWKDVVSSLSKNHRVYVLDLPGCGRSGKPKQTYTNFYFVQLLTDFVKDMICEPSAVIATGFSSPVALMAGVYDSSKFSKMLFINPPASNILAQVPDSKSKFIKWMLEMTLVGSLVYNILYARPQIDTYFTEQILYNPFLSDSGVIDTYYESAHLDHGHGRFLKASLDGKYLNMNIEHALKTFSIPASIIIGSSFKEESPMARSWTKLNSSMEVHYVAHAKMLPQLEKPAETVSVIERILAEDR